MFPQADWYWHFEENTQQLCCVLGDEQCVCLAIPANKLIPDGKAESEFTLEQTQDFMAWQDNLLCLNCSEEAVLHTLLNAIACKYFYKPLMPKNWLFKDLHNQLPINEGCLVELHTTIEQGIGLVVCRENNTALVMLLSEELQTNDLLLPQLSLVKLDTRFITPVK